MVLVHTSFYTVILYIILLAQNTDFRKQSILLLYRFQSVLSLLQRASYPTQNSPLFCIFGFQKDSVNFGLYSCDWTWLDVSTKKFILLIMRMNSSNNLKIKVTPTKFMDLPMFAAVRNIYIFYIQRYILYHFDIIFVSIHRAVVHCLFSFMFNRKYDIDILYVQVELKLWNQN